MPEFTRMEQVLLNVLADGKDHTRRELLEALQRSEDDPNISLPNLQNMLSRTRKKLLPIGQDILCVIRNGIYYQQIRLLGTDTGFPRQFDEEMREVTVK